MVYINLLPLKVRQTKVVLRLYTYIIIAASLAAMVLILLLLNLLAQSKRLDNKIAGMKAEEETLADKVKPMLGLADQESKVAAMKSLMAELVREQAVWIKILDDLADRVQGDMWLTKLQSALRPGQRTLILTIAGEAYNKLSIADFLTSLEGSPLFKDVSLEALTETTAGQNPQVQFRLRLEYAELVAAQPLVVENKPAAAQSKKQVKSK